MTVRNSRGEEKLKYNDIRDLILAEQIRRRDAGETSGFSSTLNLEARGRRNGRNSNWDRSKSKNSNGTESNLDQANKYNAGIVGKWVTLGGNAKVVRRRMKMILLML